MELDIEYVLGQSGIVVNGERVECGFSVRQAIFWPAKRSVAVLEHSGQSRIKILTAIGKEICVIRPPVTLSLDYLAPDTGGEIAVVGGERSDFRDYHFAIDLKERRLEKLREAR